MAISLYSDFKVYDEQFQGGFIETIMQNVDAFNEAAQGALVLRTRELLGHYEKEAFFDEVVASAISRRDISASGAITATKLTQDEFIGVKLNRRNGPFEVSIDSMRKSHGGGGPEASQRFSRVLGVQTAKAMPQEMLARALAALEAKLDGTSALEEDDTAATITTNGLVDAIAKVGDAYGDLALFVMHSKPYFDLVKDQVTNAIYRANGVAIMEGVPATFGKPVLVTDAAALKETDGVSTGVDAYSTLLLFPGAAVLDISEPPIAALEGPLTGNEQLFYRWQAEYAYNVKLRGCQWDTTTGGINPTNAAVATATNWDTVVADNKLLPGAILKTR
jgi:hypothetical protein